MKTLEKYKTIVFGATFFGIGIALQDPKNTLILETKIQVGSEYIDAYRFDGQNSYQCENPCCKEFRNELLQRGVEDLQGYVYMPSVHTSLMSLIQKNELNILFDASIISIIQDVNKVNVVCICQNQWMNYEAKRYVDTSNIKILDEAESYDDVTLNSLFLGKYFPYEKNGFKTVDIGKKDVFVVEMNVNETMNVMDMRNMYISFLFDLPKELKGSKLLMVSNTLCIRKNIQATSNRRIHYISSSCHENFYEALEKGVMFNEQ